MKKMQYLKSVLVGGTSVIALVHPAFAKEFDVPRGDLAAALDAYMRQAGILIVYSDDAVRGHKSQGAKGDYTETAALTQILRGTGFTAQSLRDNAIGIVRAKAAEQVAQAAPRRPAAAPVPQQSGIETIVVTAERKQENIQSVPIAVSAFTQEQLTEHQIAGGPDLIKEVPNLTFSKTNFTGYNIEVRGIGTQAISATTDPAVSVAFNGTPFIHNHFFEQEFYDVDNVEVLRGPQGTLWGRNATAGVVNVISAKATDHFEATGSIDIGNYNNRRLEGMINIPIVGDKLDMRMAAEWTKRDGYSYNDTLKTPIDGRDLWSSRVTIGFQPTESFHADLVWEHFSEHDDRLRSGKQLCKKDPGPTSFTAANGTVVPVPPSAGNVFALNAAYFSQGCLPTSLYSNDAFEVPNGFSLPFINGASFEGLTNTEIDPYASTTQSTNLRHIQSALDPIYLAKNDTVEINAAWEATPWLTVFSDTGYNRDFLWSMEDYNRFTTQGGVFSMAAGPNTILALNFQPDPAYPPNSLYPGYPGGAIFCDPQLGCSDRLVVQDISDAYSWQISQEFRAQSNFNGPVNFSLGANYLHFYTQDNYYVFSNTFTMISIDNYGCSYADIGTTNCLPNGRSYFTNFSQGGGVATNIPQYQDPGNVHGLDNQGHNYFLSQNPYMLNSYAVFGEVYYDVTDDLKLTGGLRWTDDEKTFPEIPSQLFTRGYGYPQDGVVKQKWDQWTGRFVANWSPKLSFTDQSMFYASYAHGYKAGGANPPGPLLISADTSGDNYFPTHPLTFKPENIEAFELGTKHTALDGNLVVNGDVFYYNYHNYQISEIVDRTAVNLNFNASVEGAEIQTTWSPLPGLKLGFNGGYEATKIGSNQYAIDLMDRTAGHPGWVLMRPNVAIPSNCVFPEYVAAALVQTYSAYREGNPGVDACQAAYTQDLDPVTRLPYVANPSVTYFWALPVPPGYPGFDPTTAPNNGQGFAKPLAGKELPNAPHFTVSLTADYTRPISPDWAATLHGDFYYQADSWARVFNDNPYDRIHGYTNFNLALIVTDSTGWQIMPYVKNVFNTTAITGDFLNSDDSGLTTNLFLTDPRLYGVRVTKHFGEGDWSEGGGLDFIPDFFADKDGKRPLLWLELGGNFAQLDDGWQKFAPPFVSLVPGTLPSPLEAEKAPMVGFDWEAKLSVQPEDTDWVLKAGVRYGRSGRDRHIHQSSPKILYYGKFVDATGASSEQHVMLDFTVGKNVGLGLFNDEGTSTIGGGLRIAQFTTRATADLNTDPTYYRAGGFSGFKYNYHDVYDGTTNEKRSFHGLGPELTWDASQPLVGDPANGEIDVDWGLNAAALFGRKSIEIRQTRNRTCTGGINAPVPPECHGSKIPIYSVSTVIRRSRDVTVPNLGGYIGVSMNYRNAKVSFGYRADEFFGAIDGGQGLQSNTNRGFFGPYMNITIGLGG